MLTRRAAVFAGIGAMLASPGAATTQNGAELERLMRAWLTEPANKALFTVPDPEEPTRGRVLLPENDPRVKEAASLLAATPTSGQPIDLARHLMETLPPGSKMEWPEADPAFTSGFRPGPANPVIVAFFAATGLRRPPAGDVTPWCGAFLSWCTERVGVRSARSAASYDYRDWATATMDPEEGDIVVYKDAAGGRSGHVAFFAGWANRRRDRIVLIGGNQSDQITEANWPKDKPGLSHHSFRTTPGLRSS